MNVTGGCFCGHVTYAATVDPEQVYICHCTDCQRHSGAAYGVVVAVVDNQFRLLTGKLKTHDKIADSGTVRALAFCPDCGTRIHATSVGDPDGFMGLRLGTVDQRAQLPPKGQAFCGSAQDWVAGRYESRSARLCISVRGDVTGKLRHLFLDCPGLDPESRFPVPGVIYKDSRPRLKAGAWRYG